MIKTFFYDENREFSSNSYVVGKVSSSCVVIDPGSSDNVLIDYIVTHHDKVEAILLTHGHFDHIRGVNNILKQFKYEIPVYISKDDERLLNDSKLNCASRHQEKVELNIKPTIIENELIETPSFKIKVISTPFHTLGSVCYLFSEDNALFTGDTLFQETIGREDLPTSNPSLRKESLNKLKSLSPYLVIYPGHGEITRLSDELKNNSYLQ